MNPLLQQFLAEARDFLQGIGEKLMQLEKAPHDESLMTELFRFVHTLKGNSGLFDFPEMTRVLHAGEDLLDAVRNGRVSYSQELADRLLDAMDFVGMLLDEIETTEAIGANYANDSMRLTESLRKLMAVISEDELAKHSDQHAAISTATAQQPSTVSDIPLMASPARLGDIPEQLRMTAYRQALTGKSLHWLCYSPAEECFFQGEDPFFQARKTPELVWGGIIAREPWPNLAEMDAYRCMLDFHILTSAPQNEIAEYYRYMADHITIAPLAAFTLIIPIGDPNGGPVYDDFIADALELLAAHDLAGLERAAETMLQLASPDLWLSSALRWLLLVLELDAHNQPVLTAIIESLHSLTPTNWFNIQNQLDNNPLGKRADPIATPPKTDTIEVEQPVNPAQRHDETILALIAIQREILTLPNDVPWQTGRIKAAAATLTGCLRISQKLDAIPELELATAQSITQGHTTPLLNWLDKQFYSTEASTAIDPAPASAAVVAEAVVSERPAKLAIVESSPSTEAEAEGGVKFGRRAEDQALSSKSLKVDQAKIDRLMNLIGEMVVSKNALPYLAGRAETQFGVRELSREIKAQYAIINRIAEEMQDAIMQVRMMPVSFVFQRFPRLVRDTSRKLGKEVNLILEGEETAADKNIIESLGDPLIHIVRNSLDHGLESPEVRRAAGKPSVGTLTIRASQESDRAIIDIIDDGKGIDPEMVKHKAYQKGLLDETLLEKISDQEAINLIFAPGFSTAEVVSDLSGRGVGMDVVRTAVEKINGTISLESETGKGTHIRLSLPLSMAVSNVMIIESDQQLFGIPMESVVETVRIKSAAINTIKQSLVTVLRGRIVPLKSINTLLNIAALPQTNEDDELAILVVRLGDDTVGLLVDDFHATVDIILKPLSGVLANISAYAGSALMGDGSVLMVLNIKELLQ